MEVVWAMRGAVNPARAVARHLRLEGRDAVPPNRLQAIKKQAEAGARLSQQVKNLVTAKVE